MFTGIIQTRGRVIAVGRHAAGVRLRVQPDRWDQPVPAHGDSICVNGVCLTYAPDGNEVAPASLGGRSGATPDFAFDVITETLRRSTLGSLTAGDAVNLETSLTASTPIGGHFVQGHVDAVGRVARIIDSSEEWRLTVELPPDDLGRQAARSIIPKGSVAIEGVSLTVADVRASAAGATAFDVAIIPTTLRITTLGDLRSGDAVNIETDMIARTVVHWLTHQLGGAGEGQAAGGQTVTAEVLRKAGFSID